MKSVAIIGGGVIGLCTAYFLQKEGHEVTLIDQSAMDFGASYVNAGYVSPSHIIPLAAPGVVKQGLRWMFNTSSPLYIKPRLEKSFMDWAWAFNKSCSHSNVERSVKAIKQITLLSSRLFSEIRASEGFTFQLENKGLLMLCKTYAMLEKELKLVKTASEEGLEARSISLQELKAMEPNVNMDIVGATHYQCDWHTTPQEFMTELKHYLTLNNVQFLKQERVLDLHTQGNSIISLRTDQRTLVADEFVLAAGSWSQLLSKKLGIKIPLQAGKGYRINSYQPTGITIPSILAEAKVAITPMNGFTRYAGTMEIAGINHTIRPERVAAIASAVSTYYPNVKVPISEQKEAACGLRPVSPDGRPYIGKSHKCRNLTIATGHAMMGWSMAPATGKLVAEMLSEKPLSIPLDAFHPDRKF
ncbi:NAD(P)/FAD-dependent oxidoreductase [Altibacter lentus]|uniref:NAD(P)/FAD-dependent oxidoreductase n=1 Tax=Altibacter lentus TaxID=1223410 RepID=UPI0005538E8D|nr:FAD-dependent oxidoreductase [Altibacter lentus]